MVVNSQVKLIEYDKKTDLANCLTHAVGAALAVAGLIAVIVKTYGAGFRDVFSGIVYSLTLIGVYASSAVYHGLPAGEAKRTARLADHMAIPLLFAGTATATSLNALYSVSPAYGITVFCSAWFCAVFGIVSKLFFFEKLRVLTMVVYMVGGGAMLLSAVPHVGKLDPGVFLLFSIGCILYVFGAVFCGLGIKRPPLHVVFHILVLAGSMIHYYVIYTFML